MTEKRGYDTRSVAEILASARFAPYRELRGIETLSKREASVLDRFLAWVETTAIHAPTPEDLVAFSNAAGSQRILLDLRCALGTFLPLDAAIRETVQNAIRLQIPRSRRCDWRNRAVIVASPYFAPYRDLDGIDDIALEDLRVLDRFLAFAAARGIEIPTVEDFLRFTSETASSRRLRSLEAAFLKILPGSPAIVLTLRAAIARKAPRQQRARGRPQRPARVSVPLCALPAIWQDRLADLRAGAALGGARPLSESTIGSIEDTLRAYAHAQISAGRPVTLSVIGVRLHEAVLRARGARPMTLLTAATRLRQFAVRIGEDRLLVDALRVHENALRRASAAAVKLKETRLAALPDLRATWTLAHALLERSIAAGSRATRARLRNEACCIAFWSLIPLRLADSQLRWGEEIWWDDDCYRIDVTTSKCRVPLRGRLHARLTPFLDAVALGDVDPDYIDEMRARLTEERAFLFRTSAGRALARSWPSKVWREHLGTGAHISRSRIHSELGRLGPEGVDAALALCAQADPETRRHYQSSRLHDALMSQGQDLVDRLLAEIENEPSPPPG